MLKKIMLSGLISVACLSIPVAAHPYLMVTAAHSLAASPVSGSKGILETETSKEKALQKALEKKALEIGVEPSADLDEKIKEELIYRNKLEAYAKSKGIDQLPQVIAAKLLAAQEETIKAVLDYEQERIKISDETLRSDYELAFPKVKLYQLQLALFKSPTEAQEQFEKVKSNAMSLTESTKNSSDPEVAKNEGHIEFVALSSLPPELAHELEGLKDGESLKKPVLTRFGLFFGKVEATKEAREKEFEEVKDKMRKQRESVALKARLQEITGQKEKSDQDRPHRPMR